MSFLYREKLRCAILGAVVLSLTAVFAFALGATSASAGPIALSPVTGSAYAYIEGGPTADLEVPPSSLPISVGVADDEGNSANAKISDGLDPSITGTAVGTEGGGEEPVSAGGSLNYSFAITGPAALSIPVLFNGSVSSTLIVDDGSGHTNSSAYVDVTTADGTEIQSETGGVFNDALSLDVDTVYDVSMDAEADAWGSGESHIAQTYVDPTFAIDPTFVNADQYSITYSPGLLGSVSSAPLPSSLYLFGTALAGLLFFGRMRRSLGRGAIS